MHFFLINTSNTMLWNNYSSRLNSDTAQWNTRNANTLLINPLYISAIHLHIAKAKKLLSVGFTNCKSSWVARIHLYVTTRKSSNKRALRTEKVGHVRALLQFVMPALCTQHMENEKVLGFTNWRWSLEWACKNLAEFYGKSIVWLERAFTLRITWEFKQYLTMNNM